MSQFATGQAEPTPANNKAEEIRRKRAFREAQIAQRTAPKADRRQLAIATRKAGQNLSDITIPQQRTSADLAPGVADVRKQQIGLQSRAIQDAGGFSDVRRPESDAAERGASFRRSQEVQNQQNALGLADRPEAFAELGRLREPEAQTRRRVDQIREDTLRDVRGVTRPPSTVQTPTGIPNQTSDAALQRTLDSINRQAQAKVDEIPGAGNAARERTLARAGARQELGEEALVAGAQDRERAQALRRLEDAQIAATTRGAEGGIVLNDQGVPVQLAPAVGGADAELGFSPEEIRRRQGGQREVARRLSGIEAIGGQAVLDDAVKDLTTSLNPLNPFGGFRAIGQKQQRIELFLNAIESETVSPDDRVSTARFILGQVSGRKKAKAADLAADIREGRRGPVENRGNDIAAIMRLMEIVNEPVQ